MTEMPPHDSPAGFAKTVHAIRSAAEARSLTLGEIILQIGPQAHGFLAVFLILPFLQPIPLPGVSTPFGIAIAAIGLSMMGLKPIWLPKRIARIEVRQATLLTICSKLEGLLRRSERVVRPRGRRIFALPWFRRLSGVLLFFHALLLSLPLPIPFSNFFPALVLFLIALATLEEDIAVMIAGYVAVVVNTAFFTSLILLPLMARQALT